MEQKRQEWNRKHQNKDRRQKCTNTHFPDTNQDKIHQAYQLLGVDQYTDLPDIRKAYHTLALQFHPDKQQQHHQHHQNQPLDSRERAPASASRKEDRFKEISAAYELIKSKTEAREAGSGMFT
jgi:DnaJ-class molecular chaperone